MHIIGAKYKAFISSFNRLVYFGARRPVLNVYKYAGLIVCGVVFNISI